MNRPTLAALIGCMIAQFAPGRAAAQNDPIPQPPAPTIAQNPMAPELESALPPEHAWLNTDRPLRLAHELRGHVVLLDFWTFCCINCVHILPDLEYLEDKYASEPFVVVGVHSNKFDAEGDRASIRNAIFRYHIRHPVLIDTGMDLWRRYGVRAWPTFVLIGADGRLVGFTSGEGKREILDQAIGNALDAAREAGTLAPRRVEITPDAAPRAATGLSYPGKVLAVPPDPALNRTGYLFVADSSNNRVIAATWPDQDGHASVVDIFGSGQPGLTDAWTLEAAFNDPQGLVFDPALGPAGTLYVADTKNHAIRAIDLSTGRVLTLVGTGEQSIDRRGGNRGRNQALSSPWDLALTPDGRTLYVAMAGPHQLWKVDLADGALATAIAGGIGENLIDGPARDSMLAQPSGLALSADARRLYFADSEASAVRVLFLDDNRIATIIGQGLFDFGDIDGAYPDARLQHCLGLTLYPTPDGERLLVADTYNDKVKLVHPFARTSQSFLGLPRGVLPQPGQLDLSEPAGLSFVPASHDASRPARLFIADTNNHRIVMVDPSTGTHREVIIDGLMPPPRPGPAAPVDHLQAGVPTSVALRPGADATLTLEADLPDGATVNTEAPMSVRVWRLPRSGERMPPRVILQTTLPGALPATITLPGAEIRDRALFLVECSFSWCTHGNSATCRPGELAWRVDVTAGQGSVATLRDSVE